MADDDLKSAVEDCLIRYGSDHYGELIVAAQGAKVRDRTGREVLDFTSGQMCATIGHSHPAVVEAIRQSADHAIHLFSGMIPESVARLARKIAALVPRPLKRSLFVSTGSEANEAALKMAKLTTGGFEVVALGGSWHGRVLRQQPARIWSIHARRPCASGAQCLSLPGRTLPRAVRHDLPEGGAEPV